MAFKFIILSTLLCAAVNAFHLSHENEEQKEEHYSHPKYKFAWIEDYHTSEIKSEEETCDGDRITGYYSLIEPNGHKRIIHYTADKHLGFHVTVHRELVHKLLN